MKCQKVFQKFYSLLLWKNTKKFKEKNSYQACKSDNTKTMYNLQNKSILTVFKSNGNFDSLVLNFEL